MVGVTTRPGLPLLSDYPRFARRHRLTLAVCMGVGLVAGVVWSLLQPPTYSASTEVVLTPVPVYVTPATVGLVPPEVSIDTDAQLLGSPRVLGAVADATGVDASSAVHHISVTATPGSHVLHVTVSASSPQAAARGADAAVAAFVEVRRNTLGSLRASQLRQLRLFLGSQEHMLAEEQAKRMVIPADEELFAQIVDIRAGLDELEQAQRQPAQVIVPAEPPRHAEHSNAEVPITSGAMVGLICGCLLGSRRDRARSLPQSSPAPHLSQSGRTPALAVPR